MIRRKTIRRLKSTEKCYFCVDKSLPDYKKPEILGKFISDRGKIHSRNRTGICAKHQRKLATQMKRARHLAFLPFITQVQ
ncbi:30S ribosomal protein S18 [Candidatus Shapirobacteria bacterium CG_4_10_14_0_8_um_filter_39_15]|nr:MAG: 30S ribosomal protein S18 [Candidatus Shapirobacteria bacterium CG_4_10_14_0_8_um_filter_39_15]PJE68245.1 MAG: 30S ribosomal protein S18 [Candidatus Shapirobacteria bacterium CG10_big_fil_rev_8_21_14_0_10_38_8]